MKQAEGDSAKALCALLRDQPYDDEVHTRLWHELAAGLPDFSALESLHELYKGWFEGGEPEHGEPEHERVSAYRAEVMRVQATFGAGTTLDLALALGRRYERKHEALYSNMEAVDTLFRRHGLAYWIVSGTMLAAERHQRLIPWDTDIDIEIAEADIPHLEALKEELVLLGMGLRLAFPHHYKIADNFDVFACDSRPSSAKGASLFPSRAETFPLTTFRLRDLVLPGPGRVNSSLARSYGADWRAAGRVWNYGFNNFWGKNHEPSRYVVDIDALHEALGWTLDPEYIHPVDREDILVTP